VVHNREFGTGFVNRIDIKARITVIRGFIRGTIRVFIFVIIQFSFVISVFTFYWGNPLFCGLRRNLVIYLILHQVGLDGVSARPWCLESSTAEAYLGTNVVLAVTADSSGVFDVDLEIVGSQAMDKVSGCSWHFSTVTASASVTGYQVCLCLASFGVVANFAWTLSGFSILGWIRYLFCRPC
jgi:hypothetical protein